MRSRSGPVIFDAVTFGPAKTLDLHTSPSVEAATRRAESWLRERQIAGAGEVLVITGRGRGSADGIAVLRPAFEKLLPRLRRLGVITSARSHTEGSFVVTLAPVRALFEAPRRARHRAQDVGLDERTFAGLSVETTRALRALAVRSLEALGAPTDARFVENEMRRQFSLLLPGLPDGPGRETALRRVADDTRESLDV